MNIEDDLVLKNYYADNDTNTYDISGRMIIISNDGANALVIEVNGIEVDILAGEVLGPRELNFGRFEEVKVTATAAYRLFIYELPGA